MCGHLKFRFSTSSYLPCPISFPADQQPISTSFPQKAKPSFRMRSFKSLSPAADYLLCIRQYDLMAVYSISFSRDKFN